jgi:hypothetical protein
VSNAVQRVRSRAGVLGAEGVGEEGGEAGSVCGFGVEAIRALNPRGNEAERKEKRCVWNAWSNAESA